VRVFRADATFPQGVAPLHVWVKVRLRNKDALAYLVHEYATLLESDMSSLTRSDISWCRLLLEVADTEVLPSYQWIEYIRRSGAKHIFQIFLKVDQILPRFNSFGIGKRSTTYWRPIESAPKQFAGEGSGSASVGSGGSLSSNMAKGGSETGTMGGGKPNLVKDQSVTGRGSQGGDAEHGKGDTSRGSITGRGSTAFGSGKGDTSMSSGVTSILVKDDSDLVIGKGNKGILIS
jgi:hypothetical protein